MDGQANDLTTLKLFLVIIIVQQLKSDLGLPYQESRICDGPTNLKSLTAVWLSGLRRHSIWGRVCSVCLFFFYHCSYRLSGLDRLYPYGLRNPAIAVYWQWHLSSSERLRYQIGVWLLEFFVFIFLHPTTVFCDFGKRTGYN